MNANNITTIQCPNCQTAAAVRLLHSDKTYLEYSSTRYQSESVYAPMLCTIGENKFSLVACNNCHYVFLMVNKGEKFYPNVLPSPTPIDIPEEIRKDIMEAKVCLTAGAPNGAVGMARRAVQNICLEKGANSKDDLYKQIDHLAQTGVITNELKEWAHEIRSFGNGGVHPKGMDELISEEANSILGLVESLADIIYVKPAEAKRLRERRNTGKESPKPVE